MLDHANCDIQVVFGSARARVQATAEATGGALELQRRTVLHLRLYGPLRVSVDDGWSSMNTSRAAKRRLCSRCCTSSESGTSCATSCSSDYGPARYDQPPGDSGRLKQTVHVLRRALEAGHSRRTGWKYIIERDGSYRFDAHLPYESDLEQVGWALRQANAERDRGDAGAALLHYSRAFALRRTGLLPEFRYEDWLGPFVLAEREAHLEALDAAARLYAARREHTQAVDLLKRARREDPLRESSILLLMESLWRMGDARGSSAYVCALS